MKFSDRLARTLRNQGVTHCFFVSGGNVMHLLESFSREFICVPVVHEVAAGVATEYFTAIAPQGTRAVCLVTAGPGVTNVMTAVAGAWLESRELIVVAGQVKSTDLSHETLRQRGIQEIDGVALMTPITKARMQITSPLNVGDIQSTLVAGATDRKGPVYIEVCLDAQGAETEDDDVEALPCRQSLQHGEPVAGVSSEAETDLSAVGQMIAESKRPVLLLGGGVSRDLMATLIGDLDKLGIPMATTWNALDRLDYDHPLYFGRPDTWGMRWANLLLQQADLVLAVGARLSLQQTGFNWPSFAPVARIVHVDVDEAELGKEHPRKDACLKMDAGEFLTWLTTSAAPLASWSAWQDFGSLVKGQLPLSEESNRGFDGYVNPYDLALWLSGVCDSNDIIVPCSSGGAETVMMQAFKQRSGQLVINDKALASMGYGLAGAIGAACAWPGKRVFLTEGDGGFAQNLQELGTLSSLGANVKVFLWDNEGYGSIRMTQRRYFDGHYIGCDRETGLGLPNWRAICSAYLLRYVELRDLAPKSIAKIEALLGEEGPLFVHVRIHPEQTYYPKIDSIIDADGSMKSAPLHRMSPPLALDIWNEVAIHLEESE
jgi:acetolactate synthase-1/2/3 large subunit